MDHEIEQVHEEDREFFRAHPLRRLHLRYAWSTETRDCNDPTDATQRWFVIATRYNDDSIASKPPFLANQSDISAAIDDISIHRLEMRTLESAGYTSTAAPKVN